MYKKYKYFCQYNTIMFNILIIYYSFKCINIYNQIPTAQLYYEQDQYF